MRAADLGDAARRGLGARPRRPGGDRFPAADAIRTCLCCCWTMPPTGSRPDGFGAGIECAFGAERIASALEQRRRHRQIARGQPLPARNPIAPGRRVRGHVAVEPVVCRAARSHDDLRDRDQGQEHDGLADCAYLGEGSAAGWRWSEISASRSPGSTARPPTIAVIEVSSYQAADFDGLCDIGGADLALSRAHRLAPLGRELFSRQDQPAEPQPPRHHQPRRAETVARLAGGSPARHDLFR